MQHSHNRLSSRNNTCIIPAQQYLCQQRVSSQISRHTSVGKSPRSPDPALISRGQKREHGGTTSSSWGVSLQELQDERTGRGGGEKKKGRGGPTAEEVKKRRTGQFKKRTRCVALSLVGRGPTSASAGGRVSHVSLICSTARIRAAPIRLQYFKYLQEMFTTLHVYNSTHP